MNIFYLDEDPKLCAQYHCDRHCVKMILESCQLLCTAHWMTDGEAPYKKTHINHPSNKWARESLSNYVWLCDMTMELCKEYTHRYGKRHKTQQHLEWCMVNLPNIEDKGFTGIPQCSTISTELSISYIWSPSMLGLPVSLYAIKSREEKFD